MKNTPRIMIAEDERITAEDIKNTLEDLGYEVSSIVSTGKDVVKEAEKKKPDLILMDIVLKGELDGIDASQQVRSRFDIPVVYATAYADAQILQRAKITEPYGYIIKPISPRELHCSIEMALYKKETEKRINHLNTMQRTMSQVNKLISREQDRQTLIQKICDVLVDERGYSYTWIAISDHDMQFTGFARAGLSEKQFKPLRDMLERGNFPACVRRAIADKETIVTSGRQAECPECPLPKEFHEEHDLTTRLEYDGQQFGLLCAGLPEIYDVNESELHIFRQIADDIAFALNVMEIRDEQRAVQEALIQSESKFRELVDMLPETIFEMDTAGNITFASQSIYESFGYTNDDIDNGLSYRDVVVLDDRARAAKNIQLILTGEVIGIQEYNILTKDGDIIPVMIHSIPIVQDEKVTGLRGILVNISERKRMEQHLRDSERELELTLDATTDGIWKWNFVTDELTFSPRYYTMLGYEPNEVPASFETWRDLIHPDDLDTAMSIAETYLQTKPDCYENQFRLRTKSGEYLWIKACARVVERDENGDAVRMIGNHEDITEKKLAEDALKSSEEKFRAFFEGVSIGCVLVDDVEKPIQFNNAFCDMLGYSKEELKSKPSVETVGMITVAEDYAKEMLLIDQITSGEISSYRLDKRYIKKDGSIIWVDLTTAWAFDDQGNFLLGATTVQDITERKLAEEALYHSRTLLQHTFSSLRDAVFVIDAETTQIIDCNPSATKIFGYTREEVLGRTTAFLHVDESALAKFREYLYSAVEEKGFLSLPDFEMKRRDGTVFSSAHTVTPLEDENGRRFGWVSVVSDITERKKAELEKDRRLHIESSIARISSRLLNPENLQTGIQESLEEISLFCHADRAYVFEFDSDGTTISNTYEICSDGIDPQIEELQQLPCDLFPWWMQKMGNGEIIAVPDVSAMQTEAAVEKELVESQGIRSFLLIPLMFGQEWGGFIGIDFVRDQKQWDDSDVLLVHMSTEIIGNAIARSKKEKALQETSLRLELALRAGNVGLWERDIRANKTYFSLEWKRQIGYEPDEIESTYEEWRKRLHPEDHDRVLRTLQDYLEARLSDYNIEFRLHHKDGSYRWILAQGELMKNDIGEYTRLLGCHIDITEHKQAEDALRQSEEKYRFLTENVNSLISMSDMEGNYLYVNEAHERLLGYNPDGMVGRPSLEFVHPDDQENMTRQFEENLMSGINWLKEPIRFRIRKMDGSYRWIEMNGRFLTGEDNIPDSIIAVGTDITERKQAEDDLTQKMQLEVAVAAISSKFVGLVDVDKGIAESLEIIGQLSNADRAYLFLLSDDRQAMNNTHEWCKEGVTPFKDELQELSLEEFTWWVKEFEANGIIHIPSVSELPPEAIAEREILEDQDIKSLLAYGVMNGTEMIGFLGFDNISENKKWSEANLRLLETVSTIIGNAIERKKVEDARQESEEKFSKAFRSKSYLMALSTIEEGRFIEVNDGFLETTGYTRDEVIGRTSTELNIFTDPVQRSVIINAVKENGYARDFDIDIRTKHGNLRNGLFSAELVSVEGAACLLTIMADITDRKRAEKALMERNEALEKFERVAVGRELKMVELKERIAELEKQLATK